MIRYRAISIIVALVVALMAFASVAQQTAGNQAGDEMVHLDFADVELPVLIETISKLTGKNFIFDERVRGRVTIVSPTSISVKQAYAVFESVLKVKGFTAVPGPGGVLKVIPIRDAKESNLETIMDARPSANRDRFVTRLIPLQNIDAQGITNTVKSLVSKDASMVAYAPTNTIIITDTSANIQRLMTILDAIDIETHKEELAVIKVKHADAATLGQQISEIYDIEVTASASSSSSRRSSRSRTRSSSSSAAAAPSAPGGAPGRNRVRIITDDRTNSLLVLAARSQLQGIRDLVRQLDVPVTGSGRVHVYYLKHSDAEDLAQTLNALLSGQRSAPTAGRSGGAGAAPAQLRSAVTELAEGVTVTADPATNSLVIQASKQAYETLLSVIDQLDISRPQVLVEALIVEIQIADSQDLGFQAAVRYVNGSTDLFAGTIASGAVAGATGGAGAGAGALIGAIMGGSLTDPQPGVNYGAIINAAAVNSDVNILSSPRILTSDNEEAEIRIGNNIPIITSRVQQATGAAGLGTSVNVERQDIGVTLRVTPQISEGNSVRLKIFQEITDINDSLDVGDAESVGVPLFNRQVENTVVVADGETVIIGGLIGENYGDTVQKVPWLGDIPWLGWAFKTTKKTLRKTNLLIFLTPHIVRSPSDLEYQTIRTREAFEVASGETIEDLDVDRQLEEAGPNPVRRALIRHSEEYPAARMAEIEGAQAAARAERESVEQAAPAAYLVRAGVFSDAETATKTLTTLVDAGFDGSLVSSESGGVLLYEIQIGPFEDTVGAKHAAQVLREAHDLAPAITLIEEIQE